MLMVVFLVDAPTLPPSIKESIAMDLEKYGGRVRCVSVTQNGAAPKGGAEQMSMDGWKPKQT